MGDLCSVCVTPAHRKTIRLDLQFPSGRPLQGRHEGHEGHEGNEGHESDAVAVNVQRLCVKRVKSAPLFPAFSHHSVFLAIGWLSS